MKPIFLHCKAIQTSLPLPTNTQCEAGLKTDQHQQYLEKLDGYTDVSPYLTSPKQTDASCLSHPTEQCRLALRATYCADGAQGSCPAEQNMLHAVAFLWFECCVCWTCVLHRSSLSENWTISSVALELAAVPILGNSSSLVSPMNSREQCSRFMNTHSRARPLQKWFEPQIGFEPFFFFLILALEFWGWLQGDDFFFGCHTASFMNPNPNHTLVNPSKP